MQVHRAELSAAEREDFELAIRASGRDPRGFRAELFEASIDELGCTSRRVHVATCHAAAQYDATEEPCWTRRFAQHLAKGAFG